MKLRAAFHYHFLLPLIFGLFAYSAEFGHAADKDCKPPEKISDLKLKDQYDRIQKLTFPRTNLTVLTVADQKGAEQIGSWIAPIKERFAQRIDYAGIADVAKAPSLLRGLVKSKFKKRYTYPVMLDWSGITVKQFGCEKDKASLFLIHRDGTVLLHMSGIANNSSLEKLFETIELILPPTRQ